MPPFSLHSSCDRKSSRSINRAFRLINLLAFALSSSTKHCVCLKTVFFLLIPQRLSLGWLSDEHGVLPTPDFSDRRWETPGRRLSLDPPQEGGETARTYVGSVLRQGGGRAFPSTGLRPLDHLSGDLASLRFSHHAPEGLPDSTQLSSSVADGPSASQAHFSGERPAFLFSWFTLGWNCNLTVTMET